MKNMALCLIFLFSSIYITYTAWDGYPFFESDSVHVRHQERLTPGLNLVPQGLQGHNTTNVMRYAYEVYVPKGEVLKAELEKLTLVYEGTEIGNPHDVLLSEFTITSVEETSQGSIYTIELTIYIQHLDCQETMQLLRGSQVRFKPQFDSY